MIFITASRRKIAVFVQALVLVCCFFGLSSARADIEPALSAPVFTVLPEEIASSIGPWRDREAWRDLGSQDNVPSVDTAPLPPFKQAESFWWGVVDTVSAVAAVIVASRYDGNRPSSQAPLPPITLTPPK